GDHEPVEWVATLDPPSDHRVDRLSEGVIEPLQQAPQLFKVELQVPVREGDQRTRSVREARLQRAAVATVGLVIHANTGIGRRECVSELRGAVGRTVVDDQHLQRIHHRRDLLEGELHGPLDVLLLVVCREEEGQVGTRWLLVCPVGGWLRMWSSELNSGMVGTHSAENVATMLSRSQSGG